MVGGGQSDARTAECAGPGRGGGSKDPGEFGRISKKVCMRAGSGRRQGAADSNAPRIPPSPTWKPGGLDLFVMRMPAEAKKAKS